MDRSHARAAAGGDVAHTHRNGDGAGARVHLHQLLHHELHRACAHPLVHHVLRTPQHHPAHLHHGLAPQVRGAMCQRCAAATAVRESRGKGSAVSRCGAGLLARWPIRTFVRIVGDDKLDGAGRVPQREKQEAAEVAGPLRPRRVNVHHGGAFGGNTASFRTSTQPATVIVAPSRCVAPTEPQGMRWLPWAPPATPRRHATELGTMPRIKAPRAARAAHGRSMRKMTAEPSTIQRAA